MTDQQYRNLVYTLCQKISKDRLIIQGAGGNVSWKTETHLWIKLSGTWIEDAQSKDIFGSISLDKLNELIKQEKFNVDPAMMDQDNVRPSIEVMLHAIINKRYVFHLHMVEVVAALINQSEQVLESLTKHGLHTQVIPYRKPGEELAEAVFQSMIHHPDCNLLCLENHGVVLFSDDIKEIESHIALLQKICNKEVFQINGLLNQNVPQSIQNTKYKLLDDLQMNSLVFSNEIYSHLNHLWPICPDHLVFLGPRPYLYDHVDEFLESMDATYQSPLVFVKNTGIYIHTDIFTKIHLIQLQCFVDILLRLDRYEGISVIPDNEIQKLLNWDAEKYRQQMNQ
jgi:rhamnose utilization protein RhaD (predicted bifunctional aldolase and dehydrogenase)